MEAGQTTSTTTAGTGLPVLHIKFNEQGLASLTQQTKELLFLKGETAVKLSLWCRTDPSSHEQEEPSSAHGPALGFSACPQDNCRDSSTIMLNTPQSRQRQQDGQERSGGGGYSSLTCTVPFLSIQSKAIATETSEAANGVSAGPMSAEAREDLTFIYICG